MKKSDQLMEQFAQFELSTNELKEIQGGKITGCRQDGGNSYIDGTQVGCDYKVGSNDSSGWCSTLMGAQS